MISSRFEELERECKKIKNRKIIKTVSVILFISLIFAGAYFLTKGNYFGLDKKVPIKKNPPAPVKVVIKKEKLKAKTPDIQADHTLPTLKLKPMINIPEIKEETKSKDILKPKKIVVQKVKIDKPIIKKEIKSEKKIKKPLLMITTTTADEKTVLLKNYSVKKDYTSALKLAEYFFKKKDFVKALYWAKNANKLDSTKDNSWIIYAKVKYALGEKEDAIESLKTFLNIFYSKNAEKLLQKYIKEKK